jgi:outer membrane protein assembly factor BamA
MCSSLYSCKITKNIPSNQSLLVKNNFIYENQEKDFIEDLFIKESLDNIPLQKPNKKIFLFIPASLMIWNFYADKKITKFTQWVKTNLGSEPVVFDSTKIKMSKERLSNNFFNLGYFKNTISADFITRNKKTSVNYRINLNEPFKIDSFSYDEKDTGIQYILPYLSKSLLKPGTQFNSQILKAERQRISDSMTNNGYFLFNKDIINFELDTSKKQKHLQIKYIVNTNNELVFKKFFLDTVRVIFSEDKQKPNDSFNITRVDSVLYFSRYDRFNEDFIDRFNLIRPKEMYRSEQSNFTIQRMSELNNFKLINTNFQLLDSQNNKLNSNIYLTPFKSLSYSLGAYLYNSTLGLLGNNLTFTFFNRNLTRKADRLNISLSGGLEFNFTRDANSLFGNNLITRTDLSLSALYTLDKFMTPFNYDYRSYLFSKTNISLDIKQEQRVNLYSLYTASSALSYEWSKRKNVKWIYSPLQLSYIYIPQESISERFQNILNNNPYLDASFTNTLIMGSTLSHQIFTSLSAKSNLILRTLFEASGNLGFLYAKAIGLNQSAQVFNTEISHFFKISPEVIFAHKLNDYTSIHARLKSGFGLPIGLSEYIPYIKQFYLGGPNSIRAFLLRQVGPGSFASDNTTVRDQTGNILLETNLEYRFDIVKIIKGAIFIDAGNVWNSSQKFFSDQRGIFEWQNILNDLYVGTGFGLRFDLNYFVIRADLGIPVRIPYYRHIELNQWVIRDAEPFNENWRAQNLVFNIAVGYPF